MNRLKNIEVEFLSLVSSPANEIGLILKGGHLSMIEFKKYDEERHVAYGIVYAPERVDAQGDFADRFEIEKAAYRFMKNKNLDKVDINHSFQQVEGCYVCESWIVKEGDPYFYNMPGAWAVGIKVENEEVWKSLKEGRLIGISMAGKAEREEVQKDAEGIVKALVDGIKKAFKKHLKEDSMDEKEIKERFERIEEALKGISEKVQEDLKKSFDEFKKTMEVSQKAYEERLEKLEKARHSQETGEVKKSIVSEIL